MKNKNSIWQKIISLPQAPAFSGGLMVLCVFIAMLWANSPWREYYFALLALPVGITIGNYEISHSVLMVINDALMVFFFFLVGLEIKREILVGHLRELKLALFPVLAAVGGVVAPALIYSAFPHSAFTAAGWAIPTATDIAFSLAVLSLLGNRVPVALKVFLATLAIADDIIGIIIIGVLYTSGLNLVAFGMALVILSLMYLLNKSGVRSTFVYTLLAFGVWVAVAKSGIHPTIAGVLAAMTIPVRPKVEFADYLTKAERAYERLQSVDGKCVRTLVDDEARATVESLGRLSGAALTPLTKMEMGLHSFVNYLVLPIFAFANAGIALSWETQFFSPVSLGVFAGLFIGKPVGIYCMARLTTWAKIASRPPEVTWTQIGGAGMVAGIGFTIAIFMTTLVFGSSNHADSAKIGIVAGSIISGLVGLVVIKYTLKK
ncbi:MAG TPA: Na+/H+ antiporter NhaA [Candidatus Avacidaminococcus intestinavium]|uniref:Na(+)/H(+) antiporter NhaA n=1 Tax=Candidatus Avacidaminococcus intestinavium TaxID=2840684 RepID=A0A9D1MPH6_9FIRM|nr:Na+/H+ antiporter NhaA [Candidatus Avacidaminococcus intestinavium]